MSTDRATGGGQPVMLSSVSSDAHTWNLIYLQLFLEEHGFGVVNLGSCAPDDLVLRRVAEIRPAVLVLSSVNGHGWRDGVRLRRRLLQEPETGAVPVVIGGKLGIDGRTGRRPDECDAGFARVFADDEDPLLLIGTLRELTRTPQLVED